MAVRPLIILPDPLLKRVSLPVDAVTDDIRALMDDMLDTMYAAPGIGLAAIQIGVPKRVVVMDLVKDEDKPREPHYFVNPEIIAASEETTEYEEGCLSIPEVFENVTRPKSVRIRYLDRDGELRERDCDGLMATCIQHEIDHLNGVLFIDRISRLKRDRVVKKFTKAMKASREPV
jgi:peptide deformylase